MTKVSKPPHGGDSIMSRRGLFSAAALAFGLPLLPDTAMASGRPNIALPDDLGAREPSTIASVKISKPLVAMTFDDGPHPRNTPRLLDMLREQNARATFYLIGNRVAEWPKLAARIADEGHEIGNHSWSHPDLSGYGDAAMYAQIDRTTLAIWQATGRPPVTFRPPYGAFTKRQRSMLHESRRMPTILWDVDPRDWKRPGSATVTTRILKGAHRGSIVLSHDIHRGTVDAMPETLGALAGRGLKFVTVSEIIGWPRWQNRAFRRVETS